MGHWLRHGLTSGRIAIADGVIKIAMVRPPGTDAQLGPVFAALRNHFRLVLVYLESLGVLGAGMLRLICSPEKGVPDEENLAMESWDRIPGLIGQKSLTNRRL
jgi:hypothetical protein